MTTLIQLPHNGGWLPPDEITSIQAYAGGPSIGDSYSPCLVVTTKGGGSFIIPTKDIDEAQSLRDQAAAQVNQNVVTMIQLPHGEWIPIERIANIQAFGWFPGGTVLPGGGIFYGSFVVVTTKEGANILVPATSFDVAVSQRDELGDKINRGLSSGFPYPSWT